MLTPPSSRVVSQAQAGQASGFRAHERRAAQATTRISRNTLLAVRVGLGADQDTTGGASTASAGKISTTVCSTSTRHPKYVGTGPYHDPWQWGVLAKTVTEASDVKQQGLRWRDREIFVGRRCCALFPRSDGIGNTAEAPAEALQLSTLLCSLPL